jgi:hypothetical protein
VGSIRIILIQIIIVIFLSVTSGCALFSTRNTDEYEDPILREALRVRGMDFRAVNESQWSEGQRQSRESEIQYGLETGEIVVGMKMDDVVTVWGRPRDIEVAGDPRFGNQKWIYHEGVSSRWGLRPLRVIYFEEGRVAGWETASR